MPHRGKYLVPAAALILSTAAGPAQAAPAAQPSAGRPGETVRITLITGDRVHVTTRPGHRDLVRFEPGRTSDSTAARTSFEGGRTVVIPSAAADDVRTGKLDRALFDVTTLLAERRDDANSKTLPVIVRYSTEAQAGRAELQGTAGSRILTSIDARAESVDKTEAAAFWDSLTPTGARVAGTVERISLDRRVTIATDQSVPQIGAPAAWQRGFTGKGVKIAILDTGIDAEHPDLTGRVAAAQDFADSGSTTDRQGHGTHVAGIAAGTGAASGGKNKGVAPEATLLNGKVLGDDGSGSFSGVIAGMEWAAQQGADVVNLSLGGEPTDGTDEPSLALNNLSRTTGTLFIVAAGNCPWPEPRTVSSPASADEAVAVGNLLRDGSVSDQSCRGPRIGDHTLKPEISAPGTGIVAPRASGTGIGEPVDEHYTALSGTSMATPHVVGVAALTKQAHPSWRASQLRARLISSADPQRDKVTAEGAGRVDADQATEPLVTVDAAELELGELSWPHPASDEVTRELTYTNPAAAPVRLKLAATLDPVDSARADATPRLSASELVVPANGSAKVTVTADRLAGGVGIFTGRITATADGTDPVVATFGWYTEPERYELAITGIAQNGTPANGGLHLFRLDGPPEDIPLDLAIREGKAKLRLPPGRYVALSDSGSGPTDTKNGSVTLVTSDEIDLTSRDTAITLDQRKAEPLRLRPPGGAELAPRDESLNYVVTNAQGGPAGSVQLSLWGGPVDILATPTEPVSSGRTEFSIGARWEVPPYTLTSAGKAYEVLDFVVGPRFTGTKKLAVYDAGTGTPEQLAGAKGKLAVVAIGSADERSVGDIAAVAERNSAAGVLFFNPDRPGFGTGTFWAYSGGEDLGVKVPSIRASRATAQALLAAMGTVQLTGRAVTPFVYDLMQSWPDRIPSAGIVTVPRSQLATIRESFGSHVDGMTTSETRYGLSPAGGSRGGLLVPTFPAPGARVSYVQANSTRWMSSLVYNNSGTGPMERAGSAPRTYRPGEEVSLRWLAPVQLSGLPTNRSPLGGFVGRQDGGLVVELSPFVHQQESSDIWTGSGSELVVERNGEELGRTAGESFLRLDRPAEPGKYRTTLETRRDHAFWRYSTEIRSTWTWQAEGTEDEVMPLLVADLDLPTATVLNQVPVAKPVPLTLAFRHQTGSAPSKVTHASLEISYDGSTWTPVPLTRRGNQYRANLTHPAEQAGKSPRLRLQGTDANGATVQQEVTHAYGLTS